MYFIKCIILHDGIWIKFPDVLYLQWYTYRNPIVRVGVTAVVVVRVPVRVDVTGIVGVRGVDGAYVQIGKNP